MSGHSKWHSIKHKKGAADAKRGKLFSKLNRAILVAARNGGGDPDKNIELRNALLKAKEACMPKDNIERAIKKGTGDIDGAAYKSVTYEGYGPGGVAILVDCLTDNSNRVTADLRHLLSKNGGKLGENGCVGYLFERTGVIYVAAAGQTEDALMEIALEAGADDLSADGARFEIRCQPQAFDAVKQALEAKGIAIESSEVTKLAKTEVTLTATDARAMLRIMDELDEHDDVQQAYANFDIPDDVMAEINAG